MLGLTRHLTARFPSEDLPGTASFLPLWGSTPKSCASRGLCQPVLKKSCKGCALVYSLPKV